MAVGQSRIHCPTSISATAASCSVRPAARTGRRLGGTCLFALAWRAWQLWSALQRAPSRSGTVVDGCRNPAFLVTRASLGFVERPHLVVRGGLIEWGAENGIETGTVGGGTRHRIPEVVYPALPSEGALEEVRRLAGSSATIESVVSLEGGQHSATWRVDTATPGRTVVVRQFPAGDLAAGHEAQVLRVLNGLGGLAPMLLGSDLAGRWSECPTVLIRLVRWRGGHHAVRSRRVGCAARSCSRPGARRAERAALCFAERVRLQRRVP